MKKGEIRNLILSCMVDGNFQPLEIVTGGDLFGSIFSMTNSKLKVDGIASFNLQAKRDCPFANSCLKFCYADDGSYLWRDSIAVRVFAKKISESEFFADLIVYAFSRYSGKYSKNIRIHDSGDFYSKEYFQKWFEIVSRLPNVNFYAYTKSFTLVDLNFLPANLKLIQSVGGTMDKKIDRSLPHAKIFGTLKSLLKAGYVNCSVSDLSASIKGIIKVGLVMH